MDSNRMAPFIVFFDLGKFREDLGYEEAIRALVRDESIRQVILENWELYSKEEIHSIYSMLRESFIKVSVLVNNQSNVELLEHIICNVYRVYVKDAVLDGSEIINYFANCCIDVWLILNYETYQRTKGISDYRAYKKVCIDVTNAENIEEGQCVAEPEKCIFFPKKRENKVTLPFGWR